MGFINTQLALDNIHDLYMTQNESEFNSSVEFSTCCILRGKHSSWRLIWVFISWTGDVLIPEHVAAGGAPGEAHVVSRLQLRLCEVAAVQPQSSSGSSPEAAERSVQRLPHAGLRLCAPLHSGIQPVLLLCFTCWARLINDQRNYKGELSWSWTDCNERLKKKWIRFVIFHAGDSSWRFAWSGASNHGVNNRAAEDQRNGKALFIICINTLKYEKHSTSATDLLF